jgi:type I restriction enzyme R subunit
MFDRFSGLATTPGPMIGFPTPAELRAHYEQGMEFSLEESFAKPVLTPYTGGEATRRYYQGAALRAVLEKIARCELRNEPKRAILSLATGAGKTFIAFSLT